MMFYFPDNSKFPAYPINVGSNIADDPRSDKGQDKITFINVDGGCRCPIKYVPSYRTRTGVSRYYLIIHLISEKNVKI